ncbi:MAG: DUF4197 domain-containing protein [Deltaproteobacteria bacterium]|nr:DUF4197 domain-containing protein [Deltaproteobacteria bacterium]TLN02464.1 MAG: DUF4197 domain-containing protein [bacterium]
MKRILTLAFAILLYSLSPGYAGLLEDLTGQMGDLSPQALPLSQQQSSLDDTTIVRGLKEALATGTERAVTEVAKPDGYFGNPLIKILLPDKVQRAADLLAAVGYQQQVNEFVLSMNRAAEAAAPKAAAYFGDAIRQMTVEDARGILAGGDTSATQFFEKKLRSKLFESFKPIVSNSMNKVGTVSSYQDMMGSYDSLPMASVLGVPSLDLNSYVTNKALDGLFTMVGQEEKKIRTNPAARTTDLLRKVFGSK